MTDFAEITPIAAERPRPSSRGIIDWLRVNLFGGVFNTILTLLALYLLARTIPPLVEWAFIDAVWSARNAKACRGPGGEAAGACWAFIGEKLRFILFGRYPYGQQWRPGIVVLIFIAMIAASCDRRLWGRRLLLIWLLGLGAVGVLMWGGVFGLPYVETLLWRGLPLTLILATVGMAAGFPLGVALAFGRRSELPAVPAVCVAYIELV